MKMMSDSELTICWAIVAERNKRKWIVDNGFLSYEQADHFRLQMPSEPNLYYFVARYDVNTRVFHIQHPGRSPGGGTGTDSKKRCAKCGTQYEGIGCPRCYPRVAPTAGTPTRPTRWLRNL